MKNILSSWFAILCPDRITLKEKFKMKRVVCVSLSQELKKYYNFKNILKFSMFLLSLTLYPLEDLSYSLQDFFFHVVDMWTCIDSIKIKFRFSFFLNVLLPPCSSFQQASRGHRAVHNCCVQVCFRVIVPSLHAMLPYNWRETNGIHSTKRSVYRVMYRVRQTLKVNL